MRMNFSKRALAVVMAVLMILSSASAFAFAAPKAVAHDAEGEANIAAIDAALAKLDTTVVTPESTRAPYEKNMLYSEKAMKNIFPDGVKCIHDTYGHIRYSTNAVMLYDGGVNVPTMAIWFRLETRSLAKSYAYAVVMKENIKNQGLNLDDPYWHGSSTANTYNENYVALMNAYKIGTVISSTNKDAPGTNSKAIFSHKYLEWTTPKGGNASAGNTMSFTGTLPGYAEWKAEQQNSLALLSKSIKPAFNVEAWQSGLYGTPEMDCEVPITIVNYLPLKQAIEGAKAKLLAVKNSEDIDLYNVNDINEYVAEAEKLLAVKPDAKNPDGSAKYDFSTAAKVAEYNKAVNAALSTWMAVEDSLDLPFENYFSIPEQTIVLNSALDMKGATVSADLFDEVEASLPGNNNIIHNVRFKGQQVVGYTKVDPNVNLKKALTVEPAVEKDLNNITMNYGKLSINANTTSFNYKINKNNLVFDKPETIYILVKFGFQGISDVAPIGKTFYKFQKVTFVPSTSIYIEDDAAAFNYSGAWHEATDGTNKVVSQGAEKAFANNAAYDNSTKFSAGHAKEVILNKDSARNNTIEFTFKGTGFDVISVVDNRSCYFMVDVYDTATQERIDSRIVSTFTDWKYDAIGQKWTNSDVNAADTLYQIPAIKLDLGKYDEYRVVITALYSTALDRADGDCHFIFDGVKIYNPANNNANDIYEANKEANAQYVNVNTLLPKSSLGKANTSGVVLIDKSGVAADEVINRVNAVSPSNELLLAPYQSIAFSVNGKADKVQIGVKAVNGQAVLSNNGNTIATKSATERFYDITESNGVYTIQNTGDKLVSLTAVKCTTGARTANAFALVANERTPMIAMAAIKAPVADLSIKAAAPVVSDKTVTINVTTSLDVAKLNVAYADGSAADAKITSTVNGDVKNWTVVITEDAAGTYEYTISGEYEYGYTNDSACADVTVTIEEAAAPQLTFGQKVVNFFKKLFGIKF